jgi:amino acid transporter
MSNSLSLGLRRAGVSLVGASLLLLFTSAFSPVVHAQVPVDYITDTDLLDADFANATGLGQEDLETTIGTIIRAALGFLGVIAVVIILYGGFKWIEDNVGEAKKLIIAGIIGLAIILSAYAIASFVIKELVGATT